MGNMVVDGIWNGEGKIMEKEMQREQRNGRKNYEEGMGKEMEKRKVEGRVGELERKMIGNGLER